uniref:FtsH2B n=1 Tax=Arundo donax TaxID=35708 RepID=A0A0A9F4P1_ARUDO
MWAHLFLIDGVAAEPPTSPLLHPTPFLPETIPTQPRTGAGRNGADGAGRKICAPGLASVPAYLYTPLAPSLP